MTPPAQPQKLRPWYLVLALCLVALAGLFGSTSGCSTVSYLRGSHELPVLLEQGGGDDVPAWVRSGIVRERSRLAALAERHEVAFPLSLARLLLGSLLLVAAANALTGKPGSRSLALQVLAANALLALVDWFLMSPVRDAMATAVATDGIDHGLGVAELGREENLQMFRSVVLWGERIRFAVLELGILAGGALALIAARTRQFYDAMAKLAQQEQGDEEPPPP